MRACADLVSEIHSDTNYLANDELAAIHLGIHSYEDLQKICEHYACKYYELNGFMVEQYYESNT